MRIGFLTAVAALVLVPVAAGDRVYHSQHIALEPVATGETGSGFVENIHANGAIVYAHEQYMVRGALPLTTYDVDLRVSAVPGDVTCSTPTIGGTTATFTTNAAGNGSANHVFTPEDIGPLRGLTIHAYWTLSTSGGVAYETACQTIQLD